MQYSSLSELLEAAAQTPFGITYLEGQDKEKFVSYQKLRHRALVLLAQFQKRGISPGDKMILLVNQNERFLDAFWACVLGGIVPVPLAAGISKVHRDKIFGVFEKLKDPYVFTSQENLTRLKDYAQKQQLSATYESITRQAVLVESITQSPDLGHPHTASTGDLAFIQFSSGSTSTPKGVALTHSNLLANIEAMIHGAALGAQDSTLGWMPLTHDMGLIGFHLVPLATQISQYLMPTELFVRRPAMWITWISNYKVTVTCSPNFGYRHFLQYFQEDQAQAWDLSSLRLILNGAEPISANLCREFLGRLQSYGLASQVMFPVYGLAEASLAVTFPVPGQKFETVTVDRSQLNTSHKVNPVAIDDISATELVKVGTAVKHCQFSIRDTQGLELPEEVVGHIFISGTNVTQGYYQEPALNEQLISEHGLDTGDLGFVTEGQLVVCGRSKDILFVNGQNYYPHDLEMTLDTVPGLELGKVAVCGIPVAHATHEQPAVFVLHKGSTEEFAEMVSPIRQKLNEFAGLEVEKVFPVRQIPKTTSGKIQRYQLSEQYAQGEFTAVEAELDQLLTSNQKAADPSEATSIETTLLGICQEFLQDKSIGIHDNLFELGTSSLVLTQIHDKIDELWPGKLDLTDYFDYPTISELAVYLNGTDENQSS